MHHVCLNKQGLRVAKQSLCIIQTEAHFCKQWYQSSSNRASVWTKQGLHVCLKSLLMFFMWCRLNPDTDRQTDRETDMATLWLNRPSGADSGKTTTWNASTWSSRWGQLIWTKFLEQRWLVWYETVSWPLHKDYSNHTEVLKISKLWNGFKISPFLADLCHIFTTL